MGLFITIIIFATMIVGIIKKTDLRALFIGEIFLMLLYLTLAQGSVLDEETTGNVIMDWFQYIAGFLSSNIGGITFSIILLFAYVDLMNSIHATDALANLLKKPLGRIHNSYLLAALVVVIGWLFKMVITAGPAESVLMIGTFYPVLIACGCSAATAAVAMAIFNMWVFGPADATVLAGAEIMGVEVEPAQWFVSEQLPIVTVTLVVLLILYAITSRIFDRKETVPAEQEREVSHFAEKVPEVYTVLPLLPLIIMLIFSPFFIGWIKININTACALSLTICLILVALMQRKKGTMTKTLAGFFEAFGNNLKGLGFIILLAFCFADCLNQIGGMKVISGAISQLTVPPALLAVILCLISAGITILVGSFFGALSIAMPLAASLGNAAGIPASVLCFLILMSVGTGGLCSPVNPAILVVSGKCQISPMALIRRMVLPVFVTLIAGALFASVFFAK